MEETKRRSAVLPLEQLVTAVASQLTGVDAATLVEASRRVLGYLVQQFGVDVSFLRHNDHEIRATRLIAEYPPRQEVPVPDPLQLIYFADADPVFALSEHTKVPHVFRPEPATYDYQRRIEEATKIPATSLAAVPLVNGEITTGTLGLVKFGDRSWAETEINALTAVAALFAQVQARVDAEAQLRYLADHDDLTGLHNRRSLLQHLAQRMAAGQPGPVAALFIDLDRLKAINDFLGHTAGDQFIQAFAQRIRDKSVQDSLIARIGGDEFVVIPALPMDVRTAEALAERLLGQLKEHVTIGGEILTRTVSIGVTAGVPGQDTPSDLLRRTDQAMLAAKNAGGDTVKVFAREMSIRSELRGEIGLHLRQGIESEALRLVYQPEIDLRTGQILGVEALVRWKHPTRGLLPPDSFIPVAESINLAGELDRWVLRTACRKFARWQETGVARDVLLRVNISPGQLVTGGFVDFVADTIKRTGLAASSLCMEITENVVVQDLQTARTTLTELKEVGVQIAIDDFGTGYSAMSLLKTLPVDTLKIDQAFVRRLGSNPSDLVIVRGIMVLAEGFQLGVVAEGVETETAATVLLEQRCYRAQGFLFSRPVNGDAMRRMLSDGRIPLTYLSECG